MIVRKLALGLVAVIGAAWAAAPANAQAVERSRGTYHVAVCPHGNPNGTARCHAHVVTDAQGNPHVSPNVTPSGFSPSDLRSAYGISTDGTATIAIVDAYGYSRA